MAQLQKVRGVQTTITNENGYTNIYYRGTRVVSFNADIIQLNSGGWETATTKARMTQAANQFGLGYKVFQKDWVWYVELPNGVTVEFFDNMVFTCSGLVDSPAISEEQRLDTLKSFTESIS